MHCDPLFLGSKIAATHTNILYIYIYIYLFNSKKNLEIPKIGYVLNTRALLSAFLSRKSPATHTDVLYIYMVQKKYGNANMN